MSFNPSIGCEYRYEAAIRANIKANARKTRSKEWDKIPDSKDLETFMRENVWNDFIRKMYESLIEWGGLTEKQITSVREAKIRIMENQKQRNKKIEEQKQKDIENSNFVGDVKERLEWKLTIERVINYDTRWGYVSINICRDDDNNVIVYKGSSLFGEVGETWIGKATVKSHETYQGIKQTFISRPVGDVK